MKKAILTAAALIAISTSAMADVTNPVNQAKTKDFLGTAIPIIKVGQACKATSVYDYMEAIMDTANKMAGAHDDMEKQIVNMWYMTAELEPLNKTNKKIIRFAKTHRDHPEIVKICDHIDIKMKDFIKS